MSPIADLISLSFPAGLFAQVRQNFWMPEQSSTFAPMVDNVFYFILAISTFFFCLIVGLLIVFVILYRRRPGVVQSPTPSHNNALEIMWTGIPIMLVLVIFYWGFKTFLDIRVPPADAYEIKVLAKQWSWTFVYPDGHSETTLYVPVGEPVLLVMSSQDVIHGLSIPAFRVNMDVVPGRYTKIWFNADVEGEYQLFCTQYCGASVPSKDGGKEQGHSDMVAKVVALPRVKFDQFMADAANFVKNLPPAKAGERLYEQYGCVTCHSIDGTARVGPSFKGLWGKTENFERGIAPQQVDENYIRESILEPSAKIVKGFTDQMPTFKGIMKDEEIGAIIEYIKTLK